VLIKGKDSFNNVGLNKRRDKAPLHPNCSQASLIIHIFNNRAKIKLDRCILLYGEGDRICTMQISNKSKGNMVLAYYEA